MQKNKFIFGIFVMIFLIGNLMALGNVTKYEALRELNSSEEIINYLNDNNFPSYYSTDVLEQAKIVFEQARYAEILRGEINASQKEISDARSVMRVVDWKNLTYADVLVYTDEIKSRQEKMFILFDRINAQDIQLKSSKIVSNETWNFLNEANKSFYLDRFNETESFLNQTKISFEQDLQQNSFTSVITSQVGNFFLRNLIYIISFLIVVGISIILFNKKYKNVMMKKKLLKLESEKLALKEMIKQTQDERFNQNKISGLVYNIRIKEYENRLDEINEEIPLLKRLLRKKQ